MPLAMRDKVFITAALTGSGSTQDRSDKVPRSPEQIATAAIDAAKAGAAVVHCHVRDPETGAPDRAVHLYREVVERIRASDTDVVINWPVRPDDGDLTPGTWYADVVTVDGNGSYTSGVDVTYTVQVKEDDDLQSGTVSAMLVYADGVASLSDVVAATESAVDRWAEIWSTYGLSVEVAYYESDLDTDLATPGEGGDRGMVLTSQSGESHDVTILVGETIDGSTDYYGIAGSIPGTLLATDRSGVVISWLANAGSDGSFDAEDIRVYGETLAHEVGHYMGLFHPVESGYAEYDALDDTVECGGETACDTALGDNLMYPYPVCEDWSSCTPQDQLSDGQTGVKHRYTGTL